MIREIKLDRQDAKVNRQLSIFCLSNVTNTWSARVETKHNYPPTDPAKAKSKSNEMKFYRWDAKVSNLRAAMRA